MFFHTVQKFQNKDAIGFKGRYLTYLQLYRKVLKLRNSLIENGVKRGDVVAIYIEHSIGQVISLLAISTCDAIFQIINPVLKEDQIIHQISNSNANFLIGSSANIDKIRNLLSDREISFFEIDEFGDSLEIAITDFDANDGFPVTYNIPADVSNLIYTSGSTGRSKGVVIPNRTLLDGARIVSGYLGINHESRILSLLPYNFDYGLNQLLTSIYVGATIYLYNYSFPKDLVNTLVEQKITGFAAVPSLWPNLFNQKLISFEESKRIVDLKYITTAGGMHSKELLEKLVNFFPKVDIFIMYGLTESFRSSFLPPKDLLRKIGSIGKAVPEVELLVLNDKMEPCKPGEKGELYHRGAFISYGYLNDAETTESKFIPLRKSGNGTLSEWMVKSGDIVSVDDEGYIFIHGRADAQIKTYGYRLSPAEIEEVALSFEGISHAAAFGIPDEVAGQVVYLAYTSYDKTELNLKSLLDHLKIHLPNYAIPKKVFFLESMPLTSSTKIDYPALKEIALKL